MSDFPLFALFLVAVVFLTGAFLAATPWLMKKNECFTVTVPEFAHTDRRFRSFRVRYAVSVLAATLACSVAMGVASCVYASAAVAGSSSAEALFVAVVVAASIVPAIVSFALMLFYRKKVQAIKAEEGWKAEHSESVAAIGFEEVPKPPSLAWNAAYVPIVLATLAIGLAMYPTLPDVVPLHMDFAGNVDRWEPKSPSLIAFPVLFELFMAACFVLSHWAVARSKKDVDPAHPAISAYAYGAFARAECILVLVGGLVLTGILGVLMMLLMTDLVSPLPVIVLIVVVALVFTVAAIVISVVYGQSGSRLARRMSEANGMPVDNDEHWKCGIFYCNKDDASLFLPKRFGVGWTLNWARPAVWVVVIGFLLVTIAFVFASFVLF